MEKLPRKYLPPQLFEKEGVRGCLTILLIALIMLVVEYYGWQGPYINYVKQKMSFFGRPGNEVFFQAQVYTSVSFGIFFFTIPLLFNYFLPLSGTDSNIGLKLPDWKIAFKDYSPLVLVMLPILFFVCMRPGFNQFYPLYRPETLKMLVYYELIYLTQFISVEFFFRGFGVFRLEKLCPGWGAILMVIPYSFVHIHKPFGEALGSIIAGLVLGRLSLKTGSIWPGVIVHACIAVSADLFSLYHAGKLATL